MRQVEFSTHHRLHRPAACPGVLRGPDRDNLDIGRPDNMEIIFDRQVRCAPRAPSGTAETQVITAAPGHLNAFYKHTRIKQYLNYLQP